MASEGREDVLVIACGALGREVAMLIEAYRWRHMTVTCLPASLHNTPDLIAAALRAKIRSARPEYGSILVLYGDCGTGGGIDAVLEAEGVERIPGSHCYEFFAGGADFAALCEEEPGSFFLTDYLVRNFEKLVIAGLGLDRHPQLRDQYFGRYRRLVYLCQVEDPKLRAMAAAAARRLGLSCEVRFTGLDGLARFLDRPPPAKSGNRPAGRNQLDPEGPGTP